MTQLTLAFTDRKRLARQAEKVLAFFLQHRGEWFTLRTIADATGAPEPSASARYRDLVASGFPMEKRRAREGAGLWVYRMAEEVRHGL